LELRAIRVDGRNGRNARGCGGWEGKKRSLLQDLLECVDNHDGGNGGGAGIDSSPGNVVIRERELESEVISSGESSG
jgi:hypothetical protein